MDGRSYVCECVWLAGVSEPSTVEEGEQEEEEGERVVPNIWWGQTA